MRQSRRPPSIRRGFAQLTPYPSSGQDSSFDRKLFRKSPTPGKKLAKKSKIRLHPILEDLDFTGVSANACFAQDDYDEECNYWDHPIVLEEFATSPTATAIQLDFKVEFIVVRNEKGVTLRQLLEEVADMWKSSYWLLGDHNGWTGWDYEWVSKSGTLCFEAGSYDS